MRTLFVIVLLITGCAGSGSAVPGRYYDNVAENSVAVLGIVSADEPLQSFQRKALAADFEETIRNYHPQHGLYPYEHLRRDLERDAFSANGGSDGVHELLLSRYRVNGTLTQEDWQMIRSAASAIRYLMVARIDSDTTTMYEPYATPITNRRGDVLGDKQEVTLLHERTVQVSATTFDLRTGSAVWQGSYVVKPVNRRIYTQYTGSSFTGSLAALLANSFINGRASSQHPDPPRTVEAVRESFKLIARDMFGNR